MPYVVNFPVLAFVFSLVVLSLSTWAGAAWHRWRKTLDDGGREDFGTILAATLTLLGLIIGFTFSMAVSRYDQRKNLEEEEANAIGTEYVRADLLPAADADRLKQLLRNYLDLRIEHYSARHAEDLKDIDARTAQAQADLWAAVLPAARTHQTPMVALVVEGMNDVLNSQGYAQAAAWNRIPRAAWVLMFAIAAFSCALTGMGARDAPRERFLLFILPLVVSVSLFMIADIDSPNGGVIRIQPQNLLSLAATLPAQ